MMNVTRRELLKFGLAGAGTLTLAPQTLLGATRPRSLVDQDPHFYLQIILQGGADSSYLFDARPLAMTQAGKIHNYLGTEPTPWTGTNGGTCLATRLTAGLAPYRDRFSVINGVFMTLNFEGHDQNMNQLFTGSDFGGASFVPHLNSADTATEPASLDAITSGFLIASLDNIGACVQLEPASAEKLRQRLSTLTPALPGRGLIDFVRSRYLANSSGAGRFASGTGQLLSGLDRSPELQKRLLELKPIVASHAPELQFCALMSDCFRHSIARSAVWTLTEQGGFDTHNAASAKKQPELFATVAGKLTTVFKFLANTPYDSTRSMLDVTTVMITSEFSRTMRKLDEPIDDTGTNHNSLNNTVLIGGKGICGGLVIGASDFQSADEKISPAHLTLDPNQHKLMGRPFDFKTMKPRTDQPATFSMSDYLTINSVVNTLYRSFNCPSSRYHKLGRNLGPAPVLEGLLSS